MSVSLEFLFQFGAFVVYFFDYTIGSGWWMMVLYVLQLCAIFVIRGKPYSGEQVATALITKAHCCSSALIPLLAFSWHVVSIFYVAESLQRLLIPSYLILPRQFAYPNCESLDLFYAKFVFK